MDNSFENLNIERTMSEVSQQMIDTLGLKKEDILKNQVFLQLMKDIKDPSSMTQEQANEIIKSLGMKKKKFVKRLSSGRAPGQPIVNTDKVGRNGRCPCGSGKKYKKCCL